MSIQVLPEAIAPPTPNRDRAAYLAQLVQQTQRSPDQLVALQSVSDRAQAWLSEQAIPSTRDEAWRFTDLAPLLALELTRPAPATVTPADLAAIALPEAAIQLVFVNGRWEPSLSTLAALPAGCVVGNLDAIAVEQITPYLGQHPNRQEVFTALNTVGFTDSAVIWMPANQAIATPIQVIFVTTGETSSLIQPRCLAIVGAHASLTLVETFLNLGESPHCTNSVTEIWLGANAQVNHTRVQQESPQAIHIGKTSVSQAQDSRYAHQAITLGGRVSRHDLEIDQTGAQTETTLNGLTVIQGQQVADTHSAIAFAHPAGTATQLHKCIVGDRAHGVFNGRIVVSRTAQQTNASQLNRNLLLSDRARMDTKPQLEIVADNVKCAHGATVSQLAADEVFYLESRGIQPDAAQQLLIYAFAQEVLQLIPIATLRDRLTALISSSRA